MSKFGSAQFTTVSAGNNSSFIKAFHKINDIPLRQYRNIILLRLNDGVQTTRNLSVLYLYEANIPFLSVFNIIERIQNFMKMKLHAELKGLALRLVLNRGTRELGNILLAWGIGGCYVLSAI